MPLAAIIPIRSFRQGKDRLSGFLDTETRSVLAQRLAEQLMSAAEAAGLLPVIVSHAPEVREWALQMGLVALDEDQPGLDAAAQLGTTWAAGHGLAWLVIHSDLPLVRPPELEAMAAAVEGGREVIAPSADGGTTALAARAPIAFAYGPGSFHRHLRQLRDPLIAVSVGTLHDLDSSHDLVAAARHPLGQWLEPFAGSIDERAGTAKQT